MIQNSFIYKRHSFSVVYALIGINLLGMVLVPTIAFLFKTTPQILLEKVQLSHSFSDFYKSGWTLVSYAFFHNDFWHWFFNMVLLYFSGILFLNLFSQWKFLKIYLWGIIFGGLFFMISYHIFPALSERKSYLLGASAGIMAVLIFICTYTPLYKIRFWGIIQMPLWILGVFLILTDLISIPISNSGGKIAHLGGAFCGFIWAFYLKFSSKKKVKSTKKIQQKTGKLSKDDVEYQKKIDIILKKISKSGYESLTDAEKSFLFNASKRLKEF